MHMCLHIFCSHYPQTKATVVAETPELARLTQASKNQSQVDWLVVFIEFIYLHSSVWPMKLVNEIDLRKSECC